MDQLSFPGSQRCAHHHPGQFHKLATDTPAEEERVLLQMVMDCAKFCELTGSLARLLFKKHSWRSKRRRRRTTTTTTTTTTTREEITSTAATKRKAHQTIAMTKTEFFQGGNFWSESSCRGCWAFCWYCCCCCALSFFFFFFNFLWVLASSPIADLHWERGRSGGGGGPRSSPKIRARYQTSEQEGTKLGYSSSSTW